MQISMTTTEDKCEQRFVFLSDAHDHSQICQIATVKPHLPVSLNLSQVTSILK